MDKTEVAQKLDDLLRDVDKAPLVDLRGKVFDSANFIESLAAENVALTSTNNKLQDEINRLKGEHGRPDIRGSNGKGGGKGKNFSSEKERNKGKKKKNRKPKNKKTETITINRTEVITIPKEELPSDAVFKGYEERIIQDIKIVRDNVKFKLATYYSALTKKVYTARLPKGYRGQFGPGIRALAVVLNRDSGVTEQSLHKFLTTHGVQIAPSTISCMLIKGHEVFHKESKQIMAMGLKAQFHQHIDDTGAKVKGQNWYTHVLCNDYFSYYSTQARKDRLTVLNFLCPDGLKFKLNNKALEMLGKHGMSDIWLKALRAKESEVVMTEAELRKKLKKVFSDPNKQKNNRELVMQVCALSWYANYEGRINCIVSDDAPQFKGIAFVHGLCWIHEGRHYKKLNPFALMNKKLLRSFLSKFWALYRQLDKYEIEPWPQTAKRLKKRFDKIFTIHTGYQDLDDRIAKTHSKKRLLLACLKHPKVPRHNNPAELAARVQSRIRDIHLHTMTAEGTAAKDTFATITQTARKLSVNVYDYIYDRIANKFDMPSLAEVMQSKMQFAIQANTS